MFLAITLAHTYHSPSLTNDSPRLRPRCCQAKGLFLWMWIQIWGGRRGGRKASNAWLGELGEDPESGIIRGHLVQPLHCSSEKANAQEEVPGSSPHAYYCKSWLPTSPFVPGLRFFKITRWMNEWMNESNFTEAYHASGLLLDTGGLKWLRHAPCLLRSCPLGSWGSR